MSATTAIERLAGIDRPWRRRAMVLGFLLCACLIWSGWSWWSQRRYQSAKLEIEHLMAGGRYAAACRSLETLIGWNGDADGGLHDLLGSCELARGNLPAADKAWAGVPPGSGSFERAVLSRMTMLRDAGRLAEAEQLVIEAARQQPSHGASLLIGLVPLLIDQGRHDEAIELIENRWRELKAMGQGSLDPAIKLLMRHVDMTTSDVSLDAMRASLDEAAKLASDDDRVWLGKANLAIRTGDLTDAQRWLVECEKKRPDDRAFWKARLKWAMAAGHVDDVEKAMGHLPEIASSPSEQHRINAWVARRRGDLAKESSELEQFLSITPGDISCLDRLIELHQKAERTADAAEVMTRKKNVVDLMSRYLELNRRKQPIRDAEEMARIAEQLGRRFEALGYSTIAESQEPARSDMGNRFRVSGSTSKP